MPVRWVKDAFDEAFPFQVVDQPDQVTEVPPEQPIRDYFTLVDGV